MLSVNGYYDGQGFVLTEKTTPKKNQKAIITLLDDFLELPKEHAYKKYVGKIDKESYEEIVEALKECERVDAFRICNAPSCKQH